MTTNGYATKAGLFAKRERRYLEIEDGDGDVYRLRSLTAREMRRLRESLYDGDTPINARQDRVPELLICHTLVDAAGDTVLSEDDLDEFDGMDAQLVNLLGSAAVVHTGWRTDYESALVDAAKKNSNETDSESSG